MRTLLTLFRLRMTTLNKDLPLPHFKASNSPDQAVSPALLKPLVARTRIQLAMALDSRFFNRYTDASARLSDSYLFEMQLLLQPEFKDLRRTLLHTVKLCNAQRGVNPAKCVQIADTIKYKIYDNVKKLMLQVARGSSTSAAATSQGATDDAETSFPGELLSFFNHTANQTPTTPVDAVEARVEEEFARYLSDAFADPPSVLTFWQEQFVPGNYKFPPIVAKILFAVPMSSAQIERDFGWCGRMVTPQRTSLAASKVDMAAFIACNREYLDLGQCEKISEENNSLYIPSHALVGAMQKIDDEMAMQLENIFSSSLDEKMKDWPLAVHCKVTLYILVWRANSIGANLACSTSA